MKGLRNRTGRVARVAPGQRHLRLGLAVYAGLVLLLGGLAFKPQLTSMLSSGETITAELAHSYKLRPYDSSVKVGGIEVGSVTGVEETGAGTVMVQMKVDDGVVEDLGPRPTLRVEPRTLLGGRYVVEIEPGGEGDFDGSIPLQRTGTPTELDAVLEALPETAREAVQGVVRHGAPALRDSKRSLRRLVQDAPEVLGPGADVANALQGRRPGRDLPALVDDLSATARVLTRSDGQLDAISRDLHTTSTLLARHRTDVSATLDELPSTLRAARSGLVGLDDSFARLGTTAQGLQPSAPEVVRLVKELDPTLEELEPLLDDLRPLLRDARPAVQELVPVTNRATHVLEDLHGPVLDRVNGPVADFVRSPWEGTGPYSQSAQGYQADHTFYEELAYMATNIDRASMSQDHYGSTLTFQPGAGTTTATEGLPFSVESVVRLALDEAGITDPKVRRAALRNAGVKP
jgi:phospholipid/cholesterol/gamma-HCH transport system substrate-binding protein